MFDIQQHRIHLKHAFTIARGSSDYRENLILRWQKDGIEALGCSAPNPRYGETITSAEKALQSMKPLLDLIGVENYAELSHAIQNSLEGEAAAKACLEMAVLDASAKKLDVPLFRLFGLNPKTMPPTSMTIGIDDVETVKEKTLEAIDFKVLKVKLGSDHDRAMIEAIRSVSDQTLRIDANEGWFTKEQALAEIEWLADRNVELIEQPMPSNKV